MYGREALRRKLVGLGIGELAAAGVFLLAASRAVADRGAGPAIWLALAPLVLVLAQAGAYWLLRSRSLGRPLPRAVAATYFFLRFFNVVALVVCLCAAMWWWPSDPVVATLAAAAWIFGLIEYLNYFVVRLSYPRTRWFAEVGRRRTPQLLKDLNAATH
jgi:hypothetical protein